MSAVKYSIFLDAYLCIYALMNWWFDYANKWEKADN